MSFAGKVAIVTGASSGIGAATAIALARKGAKVALVDINEVKLSEVAKQCEQHDWKNLVIKADISKDENVKTILRNTLDCFGQLDILVNNAGIVRVAPMLKEDFMETFDLEMNTNMRPAVLLTHLASPHLIKTRGNVVNMSSISGLSVPGLGFLPYAVSKAALDHFTRCAALELAEHGVRVNSIIPGPVRTDMAANAGIANGGIAVWECFKATAPLKRIGEPEEIADLVLFLASEKARSITGSTFVSDNGVLLLNGNPLGSNSFV